MAFECTTPATPTIQMDDARLRITRWDFEPGAATGWHEHGFPYVIVMLFDAILQLDDGTTVTEAPMSSGQTYVRPAGVKHDVKNGSTHPIAFIEIEIKDSSGLLGASLK